MPNVNFPASPALNAVYTNNSRSWTWNGRYWRASSTTIGYTGSTGYTGSRGDTGLGFAIAKSYASVAALTADTSPTGIVAGQFAIVETGNVNDAENSRLYLWTGSAYSYVSDLSGSQGITGPTGYAGSLGYVGSVGFVGSTGYIGSTGFVGSASTVPGYAGSLGYTGSVGAGYAGSVGYTGSIGAGYTGSIGVGYTGSAGTGGGGATVTVSSTEPVTTVDGSLWLDSETGDLGVYLSPAWITVGAGVVGYTGSQGPAGGYTGSIGAAGYVGSQGPAGGYTGSRGYTGSASTVAGYTGSASTTVGYTGSVGTGYTGSTGYAGSVGTIGYTGSGNSLPSQTGNSGKYLTTDGSTASWGSITTTTTSRAFTMAVLFGGI